MAILSLLPSLLSFLLLPRAHAVVTVTGLTECATATITDSSIIGDAFVWNATIFLTGRTSGLVETVPSCTGPTCQWVVDLPAGSQIAICNGADCAPGTVASTPLNADCVAANAGASTSAILAEQSSLGNTGSSSSPSTTSSSSSPTSSPPGKTTPPPSKSSTATTGPTSTGAAAGSGGGSSNAGAIAGGVIGALAGVAALGAAWFLLRRRRQRASRRAAAAAAVYTPYSMPGYGSNGKSSPAEAMVENSWHRRRASAVLADPPSTPSKRQSWRSREAVSPGAGPAEVLELSSGQNYLDDITPGREHSLQTALAGAASKPARPERSAARPSGEHNRTMTASTMGSSTESEIGNLASFALGAGLRGEKPDLKLEPPSAAFDRDRHDGRRDTADSFPSTVSAFSAADTPRQSAAPSSAVAMSADTLRPPSFAWGGGDHTARSSSEFGITPPGSSEGRRGPGPGPPSAGVSPTTPASARTAGSGHGQSPSRSMGKRVPPPVWRGSEGKGA